MLLLAIIASLTWCTTITNDVGKQMESPQRNTPFGITGRVITINFDTLEWVIIEEVVAGYGLIKLNRAVDNIVVN